MRYLSFFIIVVCAFQTMLCQQAQKLLTEAVYLEETSGNLDQAIEKYAAIIKNYPGDRPVAAQALLHLGMASEKLGKMQARTYYQQIVSQYPDQTEQAALARKRLARLKADTVQGVEPGGTKFITHIKLAQLPDIYGQVSPNGRYISYVNWERGNLAIYDIQTGQSQDVTDEGTWEEPAAFADMSVWSPDNTQIAYTWFSGQDAEFRIYDMATKQSRILVPQRGNLAPFPYQWTNQGFILMPYADKNHVCEALYLINTKTGTRQVVRAFGPGDSIPALRGATISPDGQYISLTLKYKDKPLETRIYSMQNLDGPPLSVLTQMDFDPVWSADGRYLYYTSTRHENRALYKRKITDGVLADRDEIILESIDHCTPSNVNPETGDFYYIGGGQNSMIMRTQLDWSNRKFGAPELILSSDKSRWGPAISPDGKRFVFCKRGTPGIAGNHICIRDLDTGVERDYDLRLRNVEQPIGHTQLQWTPDGNHVAVTYAPLDQDGRTMHRLAFVDVESGTVREIQDHRVYRHFKVILSENTLIKHDRGIGLSSVNLQSGETALLYAMPDSSSEAWFLSRSHDGRKIAFIEAYDDNEFIGHSLKLLYLDSGDVSTLWRPEGTKGFAYRNAPLWLPEDRGLLVQITDTNNKTLQFYTYDLASGMHEPFDLPLERGKDRWYHATLSPDGQSMIFAKEERSSTAWVIRNID